ncbi:MAG: DUF1993 domain-containing protein [Spongiibacter sp.]|uniref:DUF1993 domain-containing protein n=1 Tax=Spongiibacter thalassae TaxID=2721624 RepID=A0ABX1GHX1_9GAMM|nr:DUF1993 domain-containing protein [Spongiibacter thalassae]MDX1504164.1 DUF1993 domain-containing protein [Spongiibacter sp.]NKI18756.1 DUF1993 domain-containing protein [Spongiibacter thalassae]
MSFSMYQASIKPLTTGLNSLRSILLKAADYAREKNIDETVLLNSRLFPDMFPLSKQVQIACDMAKNGVSRLTEANLPSIDDTESTIEELVKRIDTTLGLLAGIDEARFAGSAERALSFNPAPNFSLSFPDGKTYLQGFVLPNFYFHVTTAYNLLRHNGLALGKGDFLGNFGGSMG